MYAKWVEDAPWRDGQILRFWRKQLVEAAVIQLIEDMTIIALVRERQKGLGI